MNWNSVVDTRWLPPCDAYTRQRGYTLPSTPNRHTMCHFVGIFCSSVSIYVYTFVPIHFWCVAFAPAFSLFNLWMCNHVFRLQSIRNKLKTCNNMESHRIMLCACVCALAYAQHGMQFRYDEAIPIEHRCHTLSKWDRRSSSPPHNLVSIFPVFLVYVLNFLFSNFPACNSIKVHIKFLLSVFYSHKCQPLKIKPSPAGNATQ